jgi:hypothetical protein
MKTDFLKSLLPYFTAVIIFILIAILYFSPVLNNKVLEPGDVQRWRAQAREITDFREKEGKEALWTNTLFSGMPAYQISVNYPTNITVYLHKLINLYLPKPANILFVSLIGFYILLLAFGVNPWLSIAGAVAYAFSSYFFIILDAGHITKAQALGYMPPIIAGVHLTFNRKYLLGAILTGLFLAMQLYVNHLQITYYTLIIILLYGIYELYRVIREKDYLHLLKSIGILLITVILALGSRTPNIWTTWEYTKYTMRGKPELKADIENQTSGLDREYATAWSYGIDETMTLFIPNFKGGASNGELGEKSATYKLFKNAQNESYAKKAVKNLPLYWGDQSFTHGPVYIGAVVMFLFIFSLFLVRGKLKWWLLTATILSIVLAWGRNFMALTNLFLDYFPLYNKFRTVSMILIIAEFAVPVLAFLALKEILTGNVNRKEFMRALKISLFSMGGIALFFTVFPGALSFTSPGDESYIQQGYGVLIDAIREDRQMLLRNDAFRSLIFTLLTAGLLYIFFIKKIKLNIFVISICALVIFDMWPIDKRYLNKDDFVSERETKQVFQPYQADLNILTDKDPYFRVFDLTEDPFRSARASYFHFSIGGYHGAKFRRYQDLIDHHISKNNINVLNMLNTKYFIVPLDKQQPEARLNRGALGNVWFSDEIILVNDADEELNALTDFDPQHQAIIDKRFEPDLKNIKLVKDSTASIKLTSYKPNQLVYESNCTQDQVAVFSEIYYDKGWNATIDGEPAIHFRADYVLRAMVIPAGKHIIEFRFEPKAYYTGNKIALASSLLLILFALGVIGMEIRKKFLNPV